MTLSISPAELAEQAVAALKWEVRFTPKPGLVDQQSSGAHTDMDLALFEKSALSLQPAFEQMGILSQRHPLDKTLRTKLGVLGREAEQAMFTTTQGVNTHKGAIWTFSLLIAGLMSTMSDNLMTVLNHAQGIALIPDSVEQTTPALTHGQQVRQRYHLAGAKGEAQAGFPKLQRALAEVPTQPDDEAWLRCLLSLCAQVDDTNIVYRRDLATLRCFQSQAQQILRDSQPVLTNPNYQALQTYALAQQISPGGSADLFAASYFLTQLRLTK
ncbi:triphosphoribosyl-dephospho-CoA synthase [Lactobacillus sp. CBA3605]|uniref:triphosphoribosyl-dephospho-CoA synthase n=1 Tax=Lactobacillus sp. CBA3605 TaxID=2099788 RepID=UPI000CFAA6A6|nr:triphosphoribosyl-dephospho-CoA synthase [Lactobacillus sp. CBA3605]AVK62095.1 triphosphoribosyl-dephospho-CoA synthase [Lactobacillus sp. CBA3605]